MMAVDGGHRGQLTSISGTMMTADWEKECGAGTAAVGEASRLCHDHGHSQLPTAQDAA